MRRTSRPQILPGAKTCTYVFPCSFSRLLLCVAFRSASADDPAPAAPPAPAAGPAGQKFAELFADWEKLFAKVKELQDAYADAGLEEKKTIEAEFRANVAEIEKLAPVVADAAKAAYLESPNTDEDAVKMVIGMVQGACRRDDYEQARRDGTAADR